MTPSQSYAVWLGSAVAYNDQPLVNSQGSTYAVATPAKAQSRRRGREGPMERAVEVFTAVNCPVIGLSHVFQTGAMG
jgi:hypothetical protein